MSSVRIQFSGLDDFNRELAKLSPRVAKNLLKRAVRASSKPLQAAYRANVPVESGTLRRSISTRVESYPRGGAMAGTVAVAVVGARSRYSAEVVRGKGARGSKPRTAKPSKYAHLVEGGTKAHTIRSHIRGKWHTVEHPGTRPIYALSRASQATQSQAADILEAYLRGFLNGG